jgi:hypothetical protein
VSCSCACCFEQLKQCGLRCCLKTHTHTHTHGGRKCQAGESVSFYSDMRMRGGQGEGGRRPTPRGSAHLPISCNLAQCCTSCVGALACADQDYNVGRSHLCVTPPAATTSAPDRVKS